MTEQGFKRKEGAELKYNISKQYNLDSEIGKKLIRQFNESAEIAFLPPLRDAIKYVKKLHEEHGYIFHCITSLSLNKNSQKLRKMNLEKLFGETVFDEIVFLDTGADKDAALEKYRGSGLFWIEDKWTNCITGTNLGLNSLLMTHGHNLEFDHKSVRKVDNWKNIYEIITHEI